MKRFFFLLVICSSTLLTAFQCENEDDRVTYDFFLQNESGMLLHCRSYINGGGGSVRDIHPGETVNIGDIDNYSGIVTDLYENKDESVLELTIVSGDLGMRTLSVCRRELEFIVTGDRRAAYKYIFTQRTHNDLFGLD